MGKFCYYIIFLLFLKVDLSAQVKIIARADSLLFIGIDNEIKIISEKIPLNQIKLTSNVEGMLKGKNGIYNVRCSYPMTNVLLKVSHKGKLVASKTIKVVRVSDPEVYVAGDTLVKKGPISKRHLVTFDSLITKINVPYLKLNVIQFDFVRVSNGMATGALNNFGQKINNHIKEIIFNSVKGDKLRFENIRVQGPDTQGANYDTELVVID